MNVVEEFLADAQKLGRTTGVSNKGIKKAKGRDLLTKYDLRLRLKRGSCIDTSADRDAENVC